MITREEYDTVHGREFEAAEKIAKMAEDFRRYFEDVRRTVEELGFGSEGEMFYFPKTNLEGVGEKVLEILGDLYDAGVEYNTLLCQEEIEPDGNYLEAREMLENTLTAVDLSLEMRGRRRK